MSYTSAVRYAWATLGLIVGLTLLSGVAATPAGIQKRVEFSLRGWQALGVEMSDDDARRTLPTLTPFDWLGPSETPRFRVESVWIDFRAAPDVPLLVRKLKSLGRIQCIQFVRMGPQHEAAAASVLDSARPEYLDFSDGAVTAAALPAAALTELGGFGVADCFTASDFASALATSPRLDFVILDQSVVDDSRLDALMRIPSLERLDLVDCDLSPLAFRKVASSPTLQVLHLRSVVAPSGGDEWLAGCVKLQKLVLDDVDARGLDPATFARLPSLERLSIYHPREADWTSRLPRLPQLTRLDVWGRHFDVAFVETLLPRLPGLKELEVCGPDVPRDYGYDLDYLRPGLRAWTYPIDDEDE